ADHLVGERDLRLQNVRVEEARVAAALIARRHADFAGRQLGHRALEVELDDVLLVLRPRLQHRIDRLVAVLAERLVALEQRRVPAGRARDVAGAEVRALAVRRLVTGNFRVAAVVGHRDQLTVTLERHVAARDVVRARFAVRDIDLACPVAADVELEARLELPDLVHVARLARRQAVLWQPLRLPARLRAGRADELGDLGRRRVRAPRAAGQARGRTGRQRG